MTKIHENTELRFFRIVAAPTDFLYTGTWPMDFTLKSLPQKFREFTSGIQFAIRPESVHIRRFEDLWYPGIMGKGGAFFTCGTES